MVSVPYEIWLQITSYLSKDHIWKLRYLNHVFLDIAMDRRYKTLEFSVRFRKSAEYIHKFERFRYPDVANRVRNISYFDHAPTVFPGKRRTKTAGSIKNRFQSLFTKRPPPALPDTVQTMACFTNLKSLNTRFFCLGEDNFFEDCVPLIHANLRACFGQLQSLVLYFPLPHFPTVILPDLFLPCLTSVTMTFFRPTEEASFETIARTTILPFINRHRQTLTSVYLWDAVSPSITMDMSPLYHGLDHIPSLRKVAVSFTASTQPPILAKFLEMHRGTLRAIEIGISDRDTTLVENLFRVVTEDFLNLEKISLKILGFHQATPSEQSLDLTIEFIRKYSTFLVSLDFMAGVHNAKNLRALLKPPSNDETAFGRLKHLYITVQTVTPDVLDIFASKLPNLHSLEVFAYGMKCRENLPDVVIDHYEFSLEMARRNYNAWKLEHLTFFIAYSGRATNNTGHRAIARAIPSLKTFNGIKMTK